MRVCAMSPGNRCLSLRGTHVRVHLIVHQRPKIWPLLRGPAPHISRTCGSAAIVMKFLILVQGAVRIHQH